MSGAPRTLTIELADATRSAARVMLYNATRDVLRVWESGNSWGDAAWSFELLTRTDARPVARRPQRYTRNVPAYREVEPGTIERWDFDFEDGTWQFPLVDQPLRTQGTGLVALYASPPSPEATELDVFMGPLRSTPATLSDGAATGHT